MTTTRPSRPSSGGGKELSGKIAVLLPDTKSSDRWEKADRRFFDEAFKAAGLSDDDFLISNAQGDPATQRSQAEQAITEGAKVILLTNLDSGSGAAIIGASKSQGVTMIDYDRLTLKGDADYYVSGDATEAGRLQGQGLIDALEKAGTKSPAIAMLHGAPTDSFATDLQKGYKEVLKPKLDSGDYTLAAEQAVPNWDGQQALTIFEQMLQKTDNKIDGVVAANDTLANSVISALQARNLDLVPVTGLDATAAGGAAHPRRRAVDDRLLLDQGPGDEGREPGGADRARREADRRRHRGRQRRPRRCRRSSSSR